jgi:F-type H+-transporting ATPase subunit b
MFALILAQTTETTVATGSGHNPILPASNEIIWGCISFVVLFVLIAKVGFPAVKKGMDNRAEKIRASLDEAEHAKVEAQGVLDDYRRQLADARGESARIIEEARQAADKIRQDLRHQAETEVAEIKQRANDDIAAQATRTMADLRARVSLLAIELAEKVVERNLDRDTTRALIDRFIDQVGSDS